MNLEKFARQAFDIGARLKLDDMELLLSSSRTLRAGIENKDVNLRLAENIFYAGVRFLRRGRLGYVPITEPDLSLLEAGIRASIPIAGRAELESFVSIDGLPAGLRFYDPEVEALVDSPLRLRNLARDLLVRGFSTRGVDTLEGMVAAAIEDRLVATMHSRRKACATRTSFAAFAEVNSKDFELASSRRFPGPGPVAELGYQTARNLPKKSSTPEAEGITGTKVQAVVHPVMLESMLRSLVAEHVYGSTALDGMSRYKLGETVASPLVTIWDDGTAPWSEATYPTDDEGTLTRKTVVIDKGVFRSHLYDRASALRAGAEPTGNGRRRPLLANVEEEHEAPLRCSCGDVFMAPGRTPLARMLASIKRGVIVKHLLGFHTANKTTGDFTNALYVGRVVRNGRPAALPEPGRWSIKGNALDVLRDVSAVSREMFCTGSAVLPWVLTELTVG